MTSDIGSPDDEFEIIPTSPIRRLEKRIEKVEGGSYSSEVNRLIEQVVDLIKSNQKIIDSSIKANNELIAEVSRLPKKMDDLVMEIREFMKLLKISAEEEEVTNVSKEVMAPLVDKLGEIIEQNKKDFENNQAVLTTLGIIEKRLKRFYAPPPSPLSPIRPASEYRTELR
jgi:predicted transcriptional regulator